MNNTSTSTVPVSLPIVATSVSLPIAAPANSTVPDISLIFSAAPRQRRTRKSKPSSTIIFPVNIDTIQKSHNRDGNESENSYHTGDVRTDDSILEDSDLARYNQIRRKLTDRDTVQDSDSGERSVASNHTSSLPSRDPGRETTNERISSVTNIPASQTQNESGYTDDRGRNLNNQNRRDNSNPQSLNRDSILPNVPPKVMPSSTALQPGYSDFYANFYRQTVHNQFQTYNNRYDNGNQRYNDYPNQANMRYNRNFFVNITLNFIRVITTRQT